MIGIAKRELEKERETLMSRSLPGFENNANERTGENDSDSDSDSESEDCGKLFACYIVFRFIVIPRLFRSRKNTLLCVCPSVSKISFLMKFGA